MRDVSVHVLKFESFDRGSELMQELKIEHGIRVGENVTARIVGVDNLKMGSKLRYLNGRIVSIVGIGTGRFGTNVCEVLLNGDIDFTQSRISILETTR